MRTECECGMQKQNDHLMQMCYWGEANSIRLCNKRSVNSWPLSVDCRYFKGNSHSIRLCRIYSMPQRMPSSVQMHHTFCLTSLPHVSFVFALRCKPGFILAFSGTLYPVPSSVHSRSHCMPFPTVDMKM